METKLISLYPIQDHPKYLRLPSLSRSLLSSILPKNHKALHSNPKIYSVKIHSPLLEGVPNLSKHKKKNAKQANHLIKKSRLIRPQSPSYIYKKMFSSKKSPINIRAKASSPSISTRKIYKKTMYFCEVVSEDKKFLTPSPCNSSLTSDKGISVFKSNFQIYRSEFISGISEMDNIIEERSSQEN